MLSGTVVVCTLCIDGDMTMVMVMVFVVFVVVVVFVVIVAYAVNGMPRGISRLVILSGDLFKN